MIKVGTIAGPETELMETAKEVAKNKYHLNIKIVEFTDYSTPNAALNDGSIDANAFQTLPFLKADMKTHGYKLAVIGKTFVYPMALYSKKIKNLNELSANATVAIPNDPSNEARALLLLQKAGLIKLKPNDEFVTPADISENTKNLKFKEIDAAQLPRILPDVTLAAINTNFAVPAGLYPTHDGLFIEGADSPYANIVVVREADKNNSQLLELIKAIHSKEVLETAKKLFKEQAVPAFKTIS